MPDIISACVSRLGSVLCQPYFVIAHHVSIHFLCQPGFVCIYTCGIARILYCLTKGLAYSSSGSLVNLVTATATGLHVQEYRICDAVVLDFIYDVRSLINCLYFIHCLGEEINAYLQPCFGCTLNICRKHGILNQSTL